jgi:hypothetical protein
VSVPAWRGPVRFARTEGVRGWFGHHQRYSRAASVTLALSFVGFFSSAFIGVLSSVEASDPSPRRRPVTVADAVSMTEVVAVQDASALATQPKVALFAPDGTKFAILLKKGDLARDANEYSLLVYSTVEIAERTEPLLSLKMYSTTNSPAVRSLTWLEDSRRLVFLGQASNGTSQVFAIDTRTKRIWTLTHHPTSITNYATSVDGRTLVFEAEPPRVKLSSAAAVRTREVVIHGQSLAELLRRDDLGSQKLELFVARMGRGVLRIPVEGRYGFGEDSGLLSVSPNGRYALIGVSRIETPDCEAGQGARDSVPAVLPQPIQSRLKSYLLYDAMDRTVAPLTNAPLLQFGARYWARDSKSLFLEMRIQVVVPGEAGRKTSEGKLCRVEVRLPERTLRGVEDDAWPGPPSVEEPLTIDIEQGLERSPELYAVGGQPRRKVLLLDLNPQLGQLQMGKVEELKWDVDGFPVIGGLYLPPDYRPGVRYPLVIQTHGFVSGEFSMDGRSEWSSAFAARPLAARGFVVLQTYEFERREDHNLVAVSKLLGSTPEQRFRNFVVHTCETAIEVLDSKGVIDTRRVGIVGFSRTVSFVGYLLTHSKYDLAAAVLVDGVDGGYFQQIAFPHLAPDFARLNGGKPPFGEGLRDWLQESPSFSLDKVNAPVQLVSLGPDSVLEMWEWYVGLTFQRKPVDFVWLPDADHMIVKPFERLVAQQDLVDWFCFWLNPEVHGGCSPDEYVRWSKLKLLASQR